MTTKMMLRRMISIKLMLSLFFINLLDDFISIGLYKKISDSGMPDTSQSQFHYLFDRFLCTNIDILSFAIFVSFAGIIVFKIIDSVNTDIQKSGIMLLTRINRKRYFLSRVSSIIIFAFTAVSAAVLQSLISHRIMQINYSISTYYIIAMVSLISILCSSFSGVLICSSVKEPRIAFVVSFLIGVLFCTLYSAGEVKIPVWGNIAIEYIYPIAPTVIFILLFYLISQQQDYITTKIKE